MADPVTIRTVDCCAACEHSRGYEGTEWCTKHHKVVYAYHHCDGFERSSYVADDEPRQDLLEARLSLKQWHDIDLLWTVDEIKEELAWLAAESENDSEPPNEATTAITADLLLSVIDILRMGHVSSTGGGDARVSWHTQDKEVRLSVSPSTSYIYHEHGSNYGTVDATSENLRQWLTWLWSDNDV